MGFFSRKASPLIPTNDLERLAAIGQAVFVGDGYFSAATEFIVPALKKAGATTPGTPEWDDFEDRFCRELLAASTTRGGWTTAGAFHVVHDLGPKSVDSNVIDELYGQAAEFLVEAGVNPVRMPPTLLARVRE